MTPDDLGRLAFNAYRSQGDGSWPWEDLTPSAREKWVRCGVEVDRMSRDAEADRIGNMVAAGISAMGCAVPDASGCDSGDPADYITDMVKMAIGTLIDRLEDSNG